MKSNEYSNNPALTYTLEHFIQMQHSDELTYRNFSILEVVDDLEFIDHNLVEDYLDELESICIPCELTDDQYKKYKYSPDLLAYDVYGSVQLDFVIMYANGMVDPKEFNSKVVKLPYASGLKLYLNSVYNSNSSYISQNRADNKLNIY